MTESVKNVNAILYENSNFTSQQALEASRKLSTDSEYKNRFELNENNLSRVYDRLNQGLSQLEAYKTTTTPTEDGLSSESEAIDKLNDLMVYFENTEMTGKSGILGTDAEKVNRTLDKMSVILRSRNVAGEFIFGGNDPKSEPLSSDLKSSTNINNGQVDNDYANTAENQSQVSISENCIIKKSFIHAGMDAVQYSLAYMYMIKENSSSPGTYSSDQIQVLQSKAKSSRDEVKLKILQESKKFEPATEYNNRFFASLEKAMNQFRSDKNIDTQKLTTSLRQLGTETAVDVAAERNTRELQNKLE